VNSNRDWTRTEAAGDFEKLPPGGYVCAVSAVRDNPGKEYLEIEYDVVDGPKRGFYTEMRRRVAWKCGYFIKSYKDSAAGFFRAFLDAVEASNPGKFSVAGFCNDESRLMRMYVGIVLGEEEYLNKDDELRTRVTPVLFLPIEDIRSGNFKTPELKKLTLKKPAPYGAPPTDFDEIVGDDDLPF